MAGGTAAVLNLLSKKDHLDENRLLVKREALGCRWVCLALRPGKTTRE
jgi:hypothetical protein